MYWTWGLAIASLVGVILNIYKMKSCFIIWAVTNLLWAAVDFYYGIYAQAALFMVYFGLAIFGMIKWSRTESR